MSEKILLSICIPTYNRVGTLLESVNHIISDPEFDAQVELIVSDNCSTDNTEKEILKISACYNNVHYFKNSSNIKDENFYVALSHGSGLYLKILNDYLYFRPGQLKQMKTYISECIDGQKNLLFYSKLRFPYKSTIDVTFKNMDSFVRAINNKMTWIGNFGVWRHQFNELACDPEIFESQLAQMIWTLHLVSLRDTFVVNCSGFLSAEVPNKSVDYHFFNIHVINYYKIYYSYLKRGLISEKTIQYDKYRILSHFVGTRFIRYYYLKEKASFDLSEAKKELDVCFKDIPYYRYLKIKGAVLKFIKGIFGKV